MIGFIKKYKEITLIVSAVSLIGVFNYVDSGFKVDEKTKLEIMEKSKIIQSKEMVLNELEQTINLKKDQPLILILDYGEHGIKSYAVEYNNLKNSNISNEILFISTYLNVNDKKESINNKKELLNKYNYKFDENDNNSIKENFNKLIKDKEFDTNDLLDTIAKKYPNNPIFVNMSYSSSLLNIVDYSEKLNKKNNLFKENTLKDVNEVKESNFELLKTIYNNPNLHISKSSGNNMKTSEKINFIESISRTSNEVFVKNLLNKLLLDYSKNDFDKFEKSRLELLNLITNNESFDENIINDFKSKFYNINNVNLNDEQLNALISLAIADYGSNYESLNLVEQLEYLKKEKNIDLKNQIESSNAMDVNTLIENVETFGKYYNIDTNYISIGLNQFNSLKSEDIKNIESNIIQLKPKQFLESNNIDDLKKLNELIENFNKDKTKLLYNTTYGSIMNPNKYSEFYKISPINQDLEKSIIYDGSSASSPQGGSNQIIEMDKKDLFKNYNPEKRKEQFDYDYQNIGLKETTNDLYSNERVR